MTFPREYPLGVPFRSQITATNFTNWDIRISEAVDGTGGGTYGGAIVLSDTYLNGTSHVSTSGTVECGDLLVDSVAEFQGDALFDSTAEITDLLTLNTGASSAAILSDVTRPKSFDAQTVDCSVGTPTLTIDLTLHDEHVIVLQDPSATTNTALLAAIVFTQTTLISTQDLKVGARTRIVFLSGNTGGCGLGPNPWPASVKGGYTIADLMGPRTGEASGVGGGGDSMTWEVECVEISPSLAFKASLVSQNGGIL